MNLLHYLAGLPWVEPLGWTLIHFLWQGALMGLGAWLVLRLAHLARPTVRYVVALGAMVFCLAAPVGTFILLAKPFSHPRLETRVLGNAGTPEMRETSSKSQPLFETVTAPSGVRRPSGENQTSTAPAGNSVRPPSLSERVLNDCARWNIAAWCVGLWFAGVLAKALRLGAGWCRIQVWRRKSSPVPHSDAWLQDLFDQLVDRLGLSHSVRLLLSHGASSPLTLGFIRPAVILPFAVISGVPRDCLEAILLHELAHIRRHDYLVNLLQSAVEVVLFYHPAIWWLGRELREIREECADQLAAERGSGRIAYAKALTALEEFRSLGPSPALGANGGSLLTRIKRLFGRQEPEAMLSGRNAAWFTALGSALLVAAGLIGSTMLAVEEKVAGEKSAPAGIVTDETGRPVAGARVWVYSIKSEWGLDNGIYEETSSAQDGRFVLKRRLPFKTPNGTTGSDHYYLLASKPGKAPAWIAITGGRPAPASYSLVLTPPKAQSFEVVDHKGKPVKGARVWLRYAREQHQRQPRFSEMFIAPEDAGLSSGVTDESGHATLTDLPDTDRSIAVSCPGYEDELACTTSREGAPRFELKPEAVLEGRVTDPLGLPVEGAVVALYPKFRFHVYFLARTDKDGHYRVGKIWCNKTDANWGTYSVSLRHPRMVAPMREVHFGSAETKTGFDIKATAGTQIAGTLIDPDTHQPVAGGQVEIRSKVSGNESYWTDEKGEFFGPVVPGEVTILVAGPPGGYYLVEDESHHGRGYLDTTAYGDRFPVTIPMEGAIHQLGTLSGAVTLPDGSPVAFCAVRTFLPGQRLHMTRWVSDELPLFYTGKDGFFTNTTFPLGTTFGLYAETPDGKYAGFLSAARRNAGEPVQLWLQPTISGTVAITGKDGKPLRKTSVRVAPLFGDVDLSSRDMTTDEAGLLKIPRVIPGVTYELSAGDYTRQAVVLASEKQESAAPRVISLSDRYTVRLTSDSGEPLGIASFKDFKVHMNYRGRPTIWSNAEGQLPILERRDTEVVVPRKELTMGKGGGTIHFQIETSTGTIVTATAAMPSNGSTLIAAKAVQPIQRAKVEDDASVPVAPNDLGGRILDSQSRPVEGARITLLNAWWFENKTPILTDAQGVFHIPDVGDKHYSCLQITKEGFAPLWLPDLSRGKGFKAQLHSSTRLCGKLVALDGTPSGQAGIKLETDVYTANEDSLNHKIHDLQIQATANENGAYDIPVESGVYRYQVTGKSGGFLRGELSVGENEIQALPEQLQPGASVTLTVVDVQTGKPIPGIPILIYENTAPYTRGIKEGSEHKTDANGVVHWDNLLPGKTEFSAPRMAQSLGPEHEQLPYSRWWSPTMANTWSRVNYSENLPKKSDGDQDITFDVQDNFKATVQMERGVEVGGTVVAADGKSVAQLEIGTVPQEGHRQSLTGDTRYLMRTDAEGKFHGYIPAGNGIVYNLCAYPIAFSNQSQAPYANAVSEPFQSKPGDKFQFRLQTPKGAWVAGRVVNSKGEPVPGMEVQSAASDHLDSPYADKTCITDALGNFRIGPLRPGRYEIRPDTEKGVNMNTRIPASFITVENGKDASIGDLVFSL